MPPREEHENLDYNQRQLSFVRSRQSKVYFMSPWTSWNLTITWEVQVLYTVEVVAGQRELQFTSFVAEVLSRQSWKQCHLSCPVFPLTG